jgi:hypothetical protein
MPSNVYFEIATGIFDTEFAGDTGIATVSQISGWLSFNVGKLNTKIHTNFTGDNPEIDYSAGNIFALQYLKHFNDKAARNALRGVATAGGNVLSIADGDNRISFVNMKEAANSYSSVSRDLGEEIDKLAYNYCFYGASPRQVGGLEVSESGVYPWYNY